jgi:hypothetical protein
LADFPSFQNKLFSPGCQVGQLAFLAANIYVGGQKQCLLTGQKWFYVRTFFHFGKEINKGELLLSNEYRVQ